MDFRTLLIGLVALAVSLYFCWRVGWVLGFTILSFFVATIIAEHYVSAHARPLTQWTFAIAIVATCVGLSYLLVGAGDSEDDEVDEQESEKAEHEQHSDN